MPNGTNLINAVDRALRILDQFSEQETELKLTDLSNAMNLNKSTVHGLLKTLAYHGYISQNPENGKYRLGFKLVERGNMVLSSVDLRRIAQPYLREVAKEIGDTVHLVILEGVEAIYIDKVEGSNSILQYSRVGKRAPLYCTAVGKTLIYDRKPEVIASLAKSQDYKRHTDKTITSPEEFIEEVARAKEKGYGVDDEELQIGLRCYAVPIFNHKGNIVASISVSGSSSHLTPETEHEMIQYLKDKAMQISNGLGYKAV